MSSIKDPEKYLLTKAYKVKEEYSSFADLKARLEVLDTEDELLERVSELATSQETEILSVAKIDVTTLQVTELELYLDKNKLKLRPKAAPADEQAGKE